MVFNLQKIWVQNERLYLNAWKHKFLIYYNEIRDNKEVKKKEKEKEHCLHLQSVDGNRSECINVVMAPLTGHKWQCRIKWSEKWAFERSWLQLRWWMSANIPKSSRPTSIKFVIYLRGDQYSFQIILGVYDLIFHT